MDILDTDLPDIEFTVPPVAALYLDPMQSGLGATPNPSERLPASSSRRAGASVALPPIQDIVDLSMPSRVQSMKQGGVSESQIAANLGITEEEVEQDLHITGSAVSNEALYLKPERETTDRVD